jgi:hypothetical protein
MYELELVRKRKRRMWAAIIGGIGVTGVATFSIAAFLGHRVGSFTVALETKNAKLTLSEKSNFVNRTSFLRVGDVPNFQGYSYSDFKEYGDEVINSEDYSYELGIKSNKNNKKWTEFLKYTFYVKNVGEDPATYDFSLKIKEVVASSNGSTLEDSFRVMVYGIEDEPKVYAKRLQVPHLDENQKADYRAPITVDENDAIYWDIPFEGYAEMFKSDTEVVSKKTINLEPDEVRKYTVVTWLERFQLSGDSITLEGASIKLGVEINAYEN